jgi:hypothetical protein
MKPQIGDVVTCKVREEAYYSNYGITPECWFEPGDMAVVASVDVPKIWHRGTFICADFEKDGRKWRVGLDPKNIRIITRLV